jgi:hypothetical protein
VYDESSTVATYCAATRCRFTDGDTVRFQRLDPFTPTSTLASQLH